ncbi:hypothetical protein T492DRAFT_896944 [Pavlovales sp. CCMP2436]|nr:hypothetical protein T492DRAFT_896944 [Pavlovales sp. CCMP2436]
MSAAYRSLMGELTVKDATPVASNVARRVRSDEEPTDLTEPSTADLNTAARKAVTALVAASSAEAALPLHVAVWDDNEAGLHAALAGGAEVEVCDPRGNTPLLLAVKLERLRLIHVLLAAGASTLARDREGFSAFQEAVQLPGRLGIDAHNAVLRALLAQTWARTEERLAALCIELLAIPDVDMEIHWQFSSWLPLVSRVLPSDMRGSSVRVDSTLRSFASKSLEWTRGSISALLQGGTEGARGMHLLDHEEKDACMCAEGSY